MHNYQQGEKGIETDLALLGYVAQVVAEAAKKAPLTLIPQVVKADPCFIVPVQKIGL